MAIVMLAYWDAAMISVLRHRECLHTNLSLQIRFQEAGSKYLMNVLLQTLVSAICH